MSLLIVSLFGAQGRNDERINCKSIAAFLVIGVMLFFGSNLLFHLIISSKLSYPKIAII
jgi:hypothetical protein